MMTTNKIILLVVVVVMLVFSMPGILGHDKEEQEKLLEARETISSM